MATITKKTVPVVSVATKETLLNRSPKTAPKSPASLNYTAQQTKDIFWKFALDGENSLLGVISKIITDTNLVSDDLYDTITAMQTELTTAVNLKQNSTLGTPIYDTYLTIESTLNRMKTLIADTTLVANTSATNITNIKGEGYNASGTYATLKAIADRLATYDGFFYNLDNVDDSLDTLSELANKITELSGSIDEILADTIPLATTSTNGLMSSTDKVKLNSIANGAEVNAQSDWNQSDSTQDDFIKNKPTVPSTDYIDTQDTNDRQLLGQYDTRSGNVVTRQTEYLTIDSSSNLQYDGNFYITGLPKALTTYANGIVNGTYTYWSSFGVNKTLGVSTDGTFYLFDTDYTSVATLKASLAQTPIYVQYKALTSYTETLEDKHYSELNVYYDNIIEQSKKGVNLLNQNLFSKLSFTTSNNTTANAFYWVLYDNGTYNNAISICGYDNASNGAVGVVGKTITISTSKNYKVLIGINGSQEDDKIYIDNFYLEQGSYYCQLNILTNTMNAMSVSNMQINKGNPKPYQPYEGEVVRKNEFDNLSFDITLPTTPTSADSNGVLYTNYSLYSTYGSGLYFISLVLNENFRIQKMIYIPNGSTYVYDYVSSSVAKVTVSFYDYDNEFGIDIGTNDMTINSIEIEKITKINL